MNEKRLRQLLFCTLQLLRKELRKRFPSDWKDADDFLFSELDMEVSELEDLFGEYDVLVCGGSAYEDGMSPKDFDKRYFLDT